MKLGKQLFNEITKKAAESPHLSMNYDLRNDENELSQRMLNVLPPAPSRQSIDIRKQVRQ